jgi:hypothetical protein
MEKFNLEDQYQLYLSLNGFDENKMPKEEKKIVRHIYFGAAAMIFIVMTREIPELSEEEACAALAGMEEELKTFFNIDI